MSRDISSSGKSEKSGANGLQLIAIQSISCAVMILIALIIRLIGGTAFSELRNSFNESMMNQSILSTIASILDRPDEDLESSIPPDKTETDKEQSLGDAAPVSGQVYAAGGQDIPTQERKILYAPAGASFVRLEIDRTAVKPLESGIITSWFGYRENPIEGGDSFHQGLDIAADSGAPIFAMFFGIVSETGSGGSYGNYIKLDHGGGLEVLYAHCSEVTVSRGTVIRSGEIVAKVGSTGASTGPHLHIEIKKDGIAYDPAVVVPVLKLESN